MRVQVYMFWGSDFSARGLGFEIHAFSLISLQLKLMIEGSEMLTSFTLTQAPCAPMNDFNVYWSFKPSQPARLKGANEILFHSRRGQRQSCTATEMESRIHDSSCGVHGCTRLCELIRDYIRAYNLGFGVKSELLRSKDLGWCQNKRNRRKNAWPKGPAS